MRFRSPSVCVYLCGGSPLKSFFGTDDSNIFNPVHTTHTYTYTKFERYIARKSLCPRILYVIFCIQDMKCFPKMAKNKIWNKKKQARNAKWVCCSNSGNERSKKQQQWPWIMNGTYSANSNYRCQTLKLYLWSEITLWVLITCQERRGAFYRRWNERANECVSKSVVRTM